MENLKKYWRCLFIQNLIFSKLISKSKTLKEAHSFDLQLIKYEVNKNGRRNENTRKFF